MRRRDDALQSMAAHVGNERYRAALLESSAIRPAHSDIRILGDWIIEQLAEDTHVKGETQPFPDGKKTYKRWAVGPIVVIFSVLPLPDQTVVIEGFAPNP